MASTPVAPAREESRVDRGKVVVQDVEVTRKLDGDIDLLDMVSYIVSG